jgi:tetratricopeptide (TPR) repeat protein
LKATRSIPVERVPLSRGRKAAFYAVALLLPLLGLALLELLLRALGVGYPTAFFLETTQGGRRVCTDNSQFTRRYFPPGLARSPQPVVFDARKSPGTVRVFVLGESAAMGDPEPSYGFPRLLELMLQDALPGRRVEVINAAVTAINSHVLRDIAADCAGREGDYWVVYMGNNEVVGPYGAGTVFGRQVPGRATIRAGLAAKSLRLGQALDAVLDRWGAGGNRPSTWGGMEMFLEQQVPADDPRMARVYDHFEANLRDILRRGRRAGAQVLVATVAGNLRDCPPFASADLRGATNGPGGEGAAEWLRRLEAGVAAQEAGRWAESWSLLDGTTRSFPNSARAWFHTGLAQAAVSNEAARASLEQARDLDTLRFRADSRINALIRSVAAGEPGVKLVDVVERVAAASPAGLAGESLFYEHVHLNLAGNDLVARTFVEQIAGASAAAALASPEVYARRLAVTDFDRHRVLDEVRQRLRQPPFATQFGADARDARLRRALDQWRPADAAAGLAAARAIYEEAMARAPGDWVLRENYATLLQDQGQPKAAEAQWRKVIELLPHDERAYYSLANVLDGQGRSGESLQFFQEALRRRPGSFEARNGLGLALANQGRTNEAVAEFEAALRVNPGFSEARVNLGQTLARQGRLEEAAAQYREVLRWNSNSVPARVNLGRVLAVQGRHDLAMEEYRAALRVNPDHAVAHYNLGNSLSALGQPGSMAAYAEAVRSQPDFPEARYNLGLGLARENRIREAREQFEAVVKLQPDFVDAHLNLGVALAKERRFPEAAAAFEQVLRRQPNHPEARRLLQLAKQVNE